MPALEFTTKGGGKVVADQKRINEEMRKQKKAIDENAKAAKAFDRDVVRALKRTQTEQERYNELIARAGLLFENTKDGAKRYRTEVKNINDELVTSTGRFKSFDKGAEQGFGAVALARFAPFLAKLALVKSAQRLITKELEDQTQLRDKSSTVQDRIARSRDDVNQILLRFDDEKIRATTSELRAIGAETRIPEPLLNKAFAGALSKTNVNVAASLDATRTAARFKRLNPEDAPALASALGTLVSITETEDARANLDFILQIGDLTPQEKSAIQFKKLPKPLKSLKAAGFSDIVAGSLIAAVSTAAEDPEFESSGTASLNLIKRLREFRDSSAGEEFDLESATADELLKQFINDPIFSKAFLKTKSAKKKIFTFESRFEPIFEKLASGEDSFFRREIEFNLANVKKGTTAGGESRIQRLKDLNELGPGVRVDQIIEQLREGLILLHPPAISTEGTAQLADVSQLSGGIRTLAELELKVRQVGGLDAAGAAAFLADKELGLRDPSRGIQAAARLGVKNAIKNQLAFGIGITATGPELPAPSELDLVKADLFAKAQKDLLDEAKRQTEELKKLNRPKLLEESPAIVGGPE